MSTSNASYYWKQAGVIAIGLALILLILLLGATIKVLLFLLSGILFAGFFRGIASWVRHYTSLSMSWALLVAVIGFLLIFVLVDMLLLPKVVAQAKIIANQLPSSIENARQYLSNYWWGQQIVEEWPENPQQLLQGNIGLAGETFGIVSSTFGLLGNLYVILLIGLFLMINPSPYVNGLVSLVPQRGQDRTREIIAQIYRVLQRWLSGKLLSMGVVAALTGIGLAILGVPLPLTLGLLAGVLAFVPNFGPILALIPAVLIAFLEGPETALYVIILYGVVQAIESNLITPFIQREMVSLPLALVVIAQVLLGILVGGLGLVLATPIVAVAITLIRMVYVEDILGQEVVEVHPD